MFSYFVDGVNIDANASPESSEEEKRKTRLDIFTDDSKIGDALNSRFFNVPRRVTGSLLPNLKPYLQWYSSLSSRNEKLGALMTKITYQNQCREFLKAGTEGDFTITIDGMKVKKISLNTYKFINGKLIDSDGQTEEEKKRVDDVVIVPLDINPIQIFPYLIPFRWFIMENGRVIKPLEYILLQENYVHLLKLFLGIIGMTHARMTIYEVIFMVSSILKDTYGLKRTPQVMDYLSNPDNIETIKAKDEEKKFFKARTTSNLNLMIKCIIGVGLLPNRNEPSKLQSLNMLTISPIIYYRVLEYMRGIVVVSNNIIGSNAFKISVESFREIEIVDKVKEILNPRYEVSKFMDVGPLATLVLGYLDHIASAFWLMGMILPEDSGTDTAHINYFFVNCHLYTSYLTRPLNLPTLKILSNFESLISTHWHIFWMPIKYDMKGVPLSRDVMIKDLGIVNRRTVSDYSFNNFSVDAIITAFDFYLDNPRFLGGVEEMNGRPLHRLFLMLSKHLDVYSDYEIRDFFISRRSQLGKTESFIDSRITFTTRAKGLSNLEIILIGDYVVSRHRNTLSSFTEDQKLRAFTDKLNNILHSGNGARELEHGDDDEEGE